ncbi:MAG: acyl-CoA synthetase [Proteobacteria bacterium]|nr:acyl-CoA synthetase [Pseudomonadota bacterium]
MRVAARLTIPERHPAFSGHFPGMPILPGVVLLDETLRALEGQAGLSRTHWRIGTAKFLKPVHPGEQLQVQHEPLANGSIRFSIVSEGALVASGTLSPVPAEGQPAKARSAEPKPRARGAAWVDIPERGSPHLLSAGVFIATRLGRRIARLGLPLVVAYFVAVDARSRRASRAFLARTLGRKPRLRDTYRHLYAFASTLLDRLYLLHGRDELFALTTEGEAVMRAIHARGAGAFLLGAHLGSFEMLGTVGRRNPGLRVAMAMYDHQAGRLATVFRDNKPGPTEIISLGKVDSMLKIHACLDEGKFVGMLADRTIGEAPAQLVNFLGTPTLFPSGPMRLAAALGRPVIFMAALYRGGNRYHAVFRQLADFSQVSRAERETAVREAIERFAGMLEQHCRSDPYNWFNFYDFWQDTPAHGSAAAG